MNPYQDFRNFVEQERENLSRLSDYWNNQVNSNTVVSKETQGRIRAAVGKTRLLLSEKFKQFDGLIEQSENKTSEKEISINDLQGFWDLVLIQVNDVKEMFRSFEPYKNVDSYPMEEIAKGRKSSGCLEQKENKINKILGKEHGKTDA